MTACLLDIASIEESESDSVRAEVACAVSIFKSRLESRGIPCVLAGGPYHPAERIAAHPALARRLLHAGIEGGSTFLVIHIVGEASSEVIDHLVRYLDAIVSPPRPVLLVANTDRGSAPLAAALRARETLGIRNRSVVLTTWSDSSCSEAIELIRQAEISSSASPPVRAWSLPLRTHVHLRLVQSPSDAPGWRLDAAELRRKSGASIVEHAWSDLVHTANQASPLGALLAPSEHLRIAATLRDVLREAHAGSVTLPALERELEQFLVDYLDALPESPPVGLDGDDFGALSGLLLTRSASDTTHMPFHAGGRRKVGSHARCWRPLVEPTPFKAATTTFVRWVRHLTGDHVYVAVATPVAFVQLVRSGRWPSDRAHGSTGDHRANLHAEAKEIDVPITWVDVGESSTRPGEA